MGMEQEIYQALAGAELVEIPDPATEPIVQRIRALIRQLVAGGIEAGKTAIDEVKKLRWREEGKVLVIDLIRGLIAKTLLAVV